MKNYIYPQNLKASANIWFWSLRDFVILAIGALISLVLLVNLKSVFPCSITLCFAFLTIRIEDSTIVDFIKYAMKFFLTDQQYFEWR